MNTNWNAKVARTEWNNGVLNIYVTYSNNDGSLSFSDVISTNSSQASDWLQSLITDRLNQLNALGQFEQTVNADPAMSAILSINDIQALNIAPISVGITPVGDIGEKV